MSVKWTEEQQKVIDLRDRNILVSAAAGSGKTAVLVERIISRITDENDPADVDRLLVVTYTEAAAAEMKERIGAAIEKKLEEQPGNVNLEQQSTLIHNASIMTIHSFCLSVIRDHFHVIGIDPAFRIAEEGELRLLMQDVLEELIENFYAEGSEAFLNFVDQYGTGRNDQKIEELILQLYEYSRSYPQPEKWLKECVNNYEINPEKMEEADVVQEAKARVRQNLTDVKGFVQQAIEVCELPAGPYMYGEMLDSDLVQIEQLEGAETFCQQEQIVSNFTWKRLSGKKDPTVDPELKEKSIEAFPYYSPLRSQIKAIKSFDRPVILVDDLLHHGGRFEALEPMLREEGVEIKKLVLGMISGYGRDTMATKGVPVDSIYYIPNLRNWFVESTLYPFIGGDTVRRDTVKVAGLTPSINMILPYAAPPVQGSTPEAAFEFSACCIRNARNILLVLESEYRALFARNLTLSRLSEAVILPLCPDKGECVSYDPNLAASVYLENDLEMLYRTRK